MIKQGETTIISLPAICRAKNQTAMSKNIAEQWENVIAEQFAEIRKTVDDMQAELKKYSATEQVGYIKPFRYMAFEALMDLYRAANKRKEDADQIINHL